jgi:hypothetical protein
MLNMCYSFRIIEWVRAEVEASNEKARERVHSVVLDMSSKFLQRSFQLLRSDT